MDILSEKQIPVNVLRFSPIPSFSSKPGNGNIKPGDHNTLSLAPQREGGEWNRKADMPTARRRCSAEEINGKIYVIGGVVSLDDNAFSTIEEYTPEGWPFNAIFPQNNLPSTWGEQKQER